MGPGYVLALTTGIVGGFGHCIGMCGPLVASYTLAPPANKLQPLYSNISPHILYNLGRITSYAAIGGIMGLAGSFVNVAGRIAGIQNIVAIAAGVMMIAMGLNITGVRGSTEWIEKHNSPILRAAHRMFASPSSFRYYPLGLILGWLPCGLSYSIFIASAGTGGLFAGMLTSLLFGIGTLPAILLFGVAITFLSPAIRGKIYSTSGAIIIIMGVYYLYRGLRLYADL